MIKEDLSTPTIFLRKYMGETVVIIKNTIILFKVWSVSICEKPRKVLIWDKGIMKNSHKDQ